MKLHCPPPLQVPRRSDWIDKNENECAEFLGLFC
jgi:hypothetical protein